MSGRPRGRRRGSSAAPAAEDGTTVAVGLLAIASLAAMVGAFVAVLVLYDRQRSAVYVAQLAAWVIVFAEIGWRWRRRRVPMWLDTLLGPAMGVVFAGETARL